MSTPRSLSQLPTKQKKSCGKVLTSREQLKILEEKEQKKQEEERQREERKKIREENKRIKEMNKQKRKPCLARPRRGMFGILFS